ncbi:IS110 family transposase [Segetibacter koreensis]|uniref:IS110 family transposase n=1 Tax=Segetibacter koreensis TaxID=398037 RepID=UPI00036E1AB3|nr:IS110 family transposase [Segetibacter koreensis]
MTKKKKVSLEVNNPNSAAIEVGTRFHFAAVGQAKEDICEFGVYSEDLKALAGWLLENKVDTVAMESTGTYWQNLYIALQEAGLKVTLVNGKFAKNIDGKKTDVKDCSISDWM